MDSSECLIRNVVASHEIDQLIAIIEADYLTITLDIAEKLNIGLSMVVGHFKQVGKVEEEKFLGEFRDESSISASVFVICNSTLTEGQTVSALFTNYTKMLPEGENAIEVQIEMHVQAKSKVSITWHIIKDLFRIQIKLKVMKQQRRYICVITDNHHCGLIVISVLCK
ncbi:hypothetical protein DICVIV_08256 [Dictyocaulus viviparus]|uniref:Uncharacterized protein n=1 Tax=Dictyocaulus viviparus TaxID=29172 RepID=A0A0D8XM60_DICVI|nr:hypothetical protein DICVIV_08256 [Dictyocaulus viviparus]